MGYILGLVLGLVSCGLVALSLALWVCGLDLVGTRLIGYTVGGGSQGNAVPPEIFFRDQRSP